MEEDYSGTSSLKKVGKLHNTLPFSGNEASMNLNPLILANIQGSSYFKVHLFKLKTYHEVVDEIYYQVKHMEPWERGSRKTAGQTGMCGGVRGVGAGGIVSTAYCLLYKLYTLRLTRKQVNGLLNHSDSPYIRALGFMYLRYTQPPGDLYDWYEDYLQDDEEIDVKAGGGQIMTIGRMLYQFLTKLDWFSTLFPRIPVPIQKQIEFKLQQYCRNTGITLHQLSTARVGDGTAPVAAADYEENDDYDRRDAGGNRDTHSSRSYPPISTYRSEHDDRDFDQELAAYSRTRSRYDNRERPPSPQSVQITSDKHKKRNHREKSREKHKKKRKHKHRTRSRSRSRSGSETRNHSKKRERERERERVRERHRDRERDPEPSREREHMRDRERDRDRDRDRKYESRRSHDRDANERNHSSSSHKRYTDRNDKYERDPVDEYEREYEKPNHEKHRDGDDKRRYR